MLRHIQELRKCKKQGKIVSARPYDRFPINTCCGSYKDQWKFCPCYFHNRSQEWAACSRSAYSGFNWLTLSSAFHCLISGWV